MERLGVVYRLLGMHTEGCRWLELASLAWQRQHHVHHYTRVLRMLELFRARIGDQTGAESAAAERVYVETHELEALPTTLQARTQVGMDALLEFEQKLRGGVATRIEPDIE
jgi:hypothetical protein